jgi:Leucine-rich repeat (LRR) protein
MEVQNSFRQCALHYADNLNCQVTWLGWLGGFLQYHYYTWRMSADLKTEFLIDAIAKKALHRDALLFANEEVLKVLEEKLKNKAFVVKTKALQYLGQAYMHSKKGIYQLRLEEVGETIYRSIQAFSNSVILNTRAAEPFKCPDDLYAVFGLTKDSPNEEKQQFVEKNLAALSKETREILAINQDTLATDGMRFGPFLELVYMELVVRCFGSFVEEVQGETASQKAKRVQAWIREYAATYTDKLDLSSKKLAYLPIQEISAFTKVIVLDVSNNSLSYIPKEISKLVWLKELDARFNTIGEIPVSLKECSALTKIFFDHNKLTAIPEQIWLHANIQYISVSDNKIEKLPESIPQVETLFINVTDNPLVQCKKALAEHPKWSVHLPQDVTLIEDAAVLVGIEGKDS